MKEQTVLNMLGQRYPKTETTGESNTKERILLAAAALFARKGYFGVSVKDIANDVGIKPASLYNHYVSKEALWIAVLERIQELYLVFFDRLEAALPQNATVEDVIDNLIYELSQSTQTFMSNGISLIQSEQFHSGMAADMYNGLLLEYSVGFIQKQLDECVNRGWARPFDTRTAATILIHSMAVINNVRVHELFGRATPTGVHAQLMAVRNLIVSYANGRESAFVGGEAAGK